MGRSGGKDQKKQANASVPRGAVKKSAYTLSVATQGECSAKLSINGATAEPFSGSTEVPVGASVLLTARVNRGSGYKFKKWEGMPSKSIGSKCSFKIESDVYLTAVAEPKIETSDLEKSPSSGHQFVDPLGKRRDQVEDRSASLIKNLLIEAGVDPNEAEAIAVDIQANGFNPQSHQAALKHLQGKEDILAVLNPAVVAKIPDDITDPSDAIKWLTGDRSLIIDPETSIPGASEAASAVSGAIDNGEKIAIYHDYDVDGITAGQILEDGLKEYGADTFVGAPTATDGFGLTEDFVNQAHQQGCSTIITADCGSESADAVALAQSLGMKVIVTDHHEIDPGTNNSADFHLNPEVHSTSAEDNTGSQIAWKFMAAIHEDRQGQVPESHYQEPLYLAGFGCRADGGDLVGLENRAFLKSEAVPEGIKELAVVLGEDPNGDMSDFDKTRYAMNVAKRTDKIRTVMDDGTVREETLTPRDVARAISDPDPAVRKEAQEKIQRAEAHVSSLEKEAKKLVKAELGSQFAEKADDGTIIRPDSGNQFAHQVIDEPGMVGIARTVSREVASKTRRPAVAFVLAGTDDDGEPLYKFSASPDSDGTTPIGAVTDNPKVKELCQSIGGHEEVFGGTCRKENIGPLMNEFNSWSENNPGAVPERSKVKDDQAKAWPAARRVSGQELENFEAARGMLAPYSEYYFSSGSKHFAPEVSVVAKVTKILDPTPKNPRTNRAIIEMEDGTTREVNINPRLAAQIPENDSIEISLGLNSTSNHSVRAFAPVS